MVQTVIELDEPPSAPVAFRWSTRISVVLALGVGIVLGYLGWVLPSPGGSLLVPTLIVRRFSG